MEALILIAHADDETLGAGGTIPKLVNKGWKVNVVALSNGVLDVRGVIEDNRADFKAACAMLGVQECTLLGFKDQKFDEIPIADLANAVAALRLQPDLIITHVDTDLNKDHRLTCDVAKIVGRPMSKPVSILGCEVPNTSFWNGKLFPANFYVDISEQIDLKVARLPNTKMSCRSTLTPVPKRVYGCWRNTTGCNPVFVSPRPSRSSAGTKAASPNIA
jgi:LmbE family N-acetylglucosaminyl deacetylase